MAGRDRDLLCMAPVTPVLCQLFTVSVKHGVVVQFDDHGIRHGLDPGEDRPSGQTAVIRHNADTLVFNSLTVLDIDRGRQIDVAVIIIADSELLIVDLRIFADDRSFGRDIARGRFCSCSDTVEGAVKLLQGHPGFFRRGFCGCRSGSIRRSGIRRGGTAVPVLRASGIRYSPGFSVAAAVPVLSLLRSCSCRSSRVVFCFCSAVLPACLRACRTFFCCGRGGCFGSVLSCVL